VAVLGLVALAGMVLVEGLGRLGDVWRRCERWVLGLVMGGLAALVCAQALGQKFRLALTWTEEICVLGVAVVVWLGLPALISERDLLSVEVGRLARHRVGRLAAAVATGLFLAVLLVLAFEAMPGWSLRTPELRVPRRLLWGLVPLAAVLSLAAVVSRRTEKMPRHEYNIGSSLPSANR
jgi:TRAP-type C4-dicarboxylate transport system permease small subunit